MAFQPQAISLNVSAQVTTDPGSPALDRGAGVKFSFVFNGRVTSPRNLATLVATFCQFRQREIGS
jgi:hypothetical protein